MAMEEIVGVGLLLRGKAEFLSGMESARKVTGEFGAATKATAAESAAAAAKTKTQQDALKSVTDSTVRARDAQRAYEKALADHADPAAAAARADEALATAQARVSETSADAEAATSGLSAANSNLAAANHELRLAEEELAGVTADTTVAEREALEASRERAAADVTAAEEIRNKAVADSESAAAADRSAQADLEGAQAARTRAGATGEQVVASRAARDEAVAAVGTATAAAEAESGLAERTRLAGVQKISTWQAFRQEVLGSSAAVETASAGVADEEAATAARIQASNDAKIAAFQNFSGKAAIASAGVAAVTGLVVVKTSEMAASFDQSMERISTQAGVPESHLDGLKQSVLGLAGKVGEDPDSLADAMFHIQSSFAGAGMSAKQATDILTVAAEGARMGGANLVDVTNAMDAAIVSGIPGVQDYNQAMGALNATVGAGDMKMQDLANAMGTGVLAVIKGYGATMRDASAALAVFGDNNIRGAAAGNQLRMTVQALVAPTKQGKELLAQLGMTTDTLAKDMQTGGLNGAMTDLHQRMEKAGITGVQTGKFLVDAFGKRAGAGVSILMGQYDRFQQKLGEVDKGAKNFAEDWTKQSQTAAQKSADFHAALSALGVQLGNVFLPALTKVTSVLATVITFFAEHRAAAVALAVVIGTVLVTSLIVFGIALWGVVAGMVATGAAALGIEIAAAPLIGIIALVVAGVALLAFGIYELWTHWDTVWGAISGVVSKAWAAVTGAISAGWSKVTGFFSGIWSWITGFFSNWGSTILAVLVPFIGIPLLIVKHWGEIVDFFKKLPGNVAEGLGYALGAAARWLYELPGRIRDGVKNAKTWLLDTGRDVLVGMRDGIVDGYHAVVDWFVALPGRVRTFLHDGKNWLLTTGRDILTGLWDGIKTGWASGIAFLKALPGNVRDGFRDAKNWLLNTGRDIIHGLITGLENAGHAVVDFFVGLKDRFLGGFKRGLGIASPSTVFAQIGTWVLQGFLGGLQVMVNVVVGFFTGFATRLASGFRVGMQQVAAVAIWLYQNVLLPVVHGIDAGFDWLVGQLQGAENLIMNGWRLVASIATWLYQVAVLGAVHGIDTAFDWVQAQLAAAGQLIMTGLRLLGSIFTWLWQVSVQGAVTGISTIWHWLHDTVIKPVGDAISSVVHSIGQAFSDTVDWIKRTWQTIADIVRVPVSFVVNTVYSKGIKPTWDAIAGVFGLPQAPAAPAFASGGIAGDDPQGGAGLAHAAAGRVMPGYEPGYDRFHIMVGGGEAIMIPEWTRAMLAHFGPAAIALMNHEARAGRHPLLGHGANWTGNHTARVAGPRAGGVRDSPFAGMYAEGGMVPDLPIPPVPGPGPDLSIGASILSGFGNLFNLPQLVTDPKGYFDGLFKPFTGALDVMGGSRFMQAMKDVPAKAIDGIVTKVKDWLASMMSGGAVMGPESASHALDIVNATKAKGLHHDAAVIALMTGLQESGIRVLANPSVPASMALPHDGVGHDHDSVGIFQQRQSWGPTPLLMNPFGSAQLFLNRLGGGPYGDFGAAAQRVQVSAFPGAYSKWQGQATALAGPMFSGGGIVGVSGGEVFGGARALGGPITPGQAYLVGESGPELVTPSSPGTVVPADVTSALRDRGGDTPAGGGARPGRGDVHFHPGAIVVQAATDPHATAQAVADVVSDRMARQ